jgi:hypothetical protein
MKIGFFGDSFVHEMSNPHSWYHNYDTFIKLIKQHYDAEIVNLGVGGSSYWDAMLKQFPKFESNLPDVCIFCWTDPSRVYHPKVRNIGSWLTMKQDWKDLSVNQLMYRKEYNAGKEYFTHLYDHEKGQREAVASFYHFDREVLAPLQDRTKIIHLWSYGSPTEWQQEDPYYPSNIHYIYRWQTGTEIRPSLKCFSPIGRDTLDDNFAANHLGSKLNNTLVANIVIEAVDNHANGQLLIKDAMWEQHQKD